MKILFLLLSVLVSHILQHDESSITGTWLTEEGDGKIQIYQKNNKYHGKIIWLKEPMNPTTKKPQTDSKNPNEELRNRQVIGLVVLKNLKYNPGEKKWEEGTIYDPKTGSSYKCTIELKDKNTLNVRGYIGFSLVGRTTTWKKVN
ncbi:MAG: DUF2147 domain-containing protein [Bacteroidota bacterium]